MTPISAAGGFVQAVKLTLFLLLLFFFGLDWLLKSPQHGRIPACSAAVTRQNPSSTDLEFSLIALKGIYNRSYEQKPSFRFVFTHVNRQAHTHTHTHTRESSLSCKFEFHMHIKHKYTQKDRFISK